MKIKGKQLKEVPIYSLYLPRGDNDEDIVEIRAQAVVDYDEFHKLLPVPKPPDKIVKGKGLQPDFESKDYLQAVEMYGRLKTAWMCLKSLQATPGLEWEIVNMADPNSWEKFEDELKASGFTDIERQRILNLIMDANSLNEDKLKEARERFLSVQHRKAQESASSSQNSVLASTPSGEPANGSASDRQESENPGTN